MLSRRLYLPAKRAGSEELPKIVAVDLQPMAPIEGIIDIQVRIFRVSALQEYSVLAGCVPNSLRCICRATLQARRR